MITILLLAMLASAPDKVTERVKIDGDTIRVTRKGSDVEVASKALVVSKSLELRERYRRAVQQVTGCDLSDELWFGNKVKGRLQCPPSKS